MLKFRRVKSIGIIVLLSVFILLNCTKEVARDKLVKRNGIYYEINSENPFSGKSVVMHENGQQMETGELKDGKLHGTGKRWYENGQQKEITEFKHGELHGTQEKWYENGQQQEISEWEDGVRIK